MGAVWGYEPILVSARDCDKFNVESCSTPHTTVQATTDLRGIERAVVAVDA